MKLVQFSLERFRSFIDRSTVSFSDNTVILGPNNEGKTNILAALVISFNFLKSISEDKFPVSFKKNVLFYLIEEAFGIKRTQQIKDNKQGVTYSWERDYPVSLKETLKEESTKSPNRDSVFVLYFKMTESENDEIKKETKYSFKNKTIPIELNMGERRVRVAILLPESISEENTVAIIHFVSKNISISYIDAVRTANAATELIDKLLENELKRVYQSEEYMSAENKLIRFLTPPISNFSKMLRNDLQLFVPSIQDNTLTFYHAYQPLRDLHVLIDDGNKTPISQKGVGVQSLIVLSLAQKLALSKTHPQCLLAIEEPEAHLHPKTIHEIKKVLSEITRNNQLIITTHSPLLVNTNEIQSNVIVSRNNAHQATSLKEIREVLGVLASDNLLFADSNILVEGESDERILRKILPAISPKIKKALKNDSLFIVNCQGASKISSFVDWTRNCLYKIHVVLDGDSEGQREKDNIVSIAPEISNSITLFSLYGMKYSEIEDLIDPKSYIDSLTSCFQWAEKAKLLTSLKGKSQAWSERLIRFSANNGHPYKENNNKLIKEKTVVADAVVKQGLSALRPGARELFETLAHNIEKMLDE